MDLKKILGKKAFISVFITNDRDMKKLNKEYLNRDYTTDVLSFDIKENQEDGSLYLGDIIVNKDQAKRQAKNYGNDLEEEISELVGHGVLHLLGVHHPGDDGNVKIDKRKSLGLDGKVIKKKTK